MTDEKDKILDFQLPAKRERIVKGMSVLYDSEEPQKITYSHSTLCQTSLPFVKSTEREWKNRNGDSIVVMEAGQVYDLKIDDVVKLDLPYGTKPRLIMYDWSRQAILTQNPVIEVENTLYAFLKRLRLPTEGRVYSMTKKQIAALAACSMTVGRPSKNGGATGYGRIVSNLDILFANDDSQKVLWPNTVTLSNEFFKSLMQHAVPLDEGALFLLKDSALELDLYSMLAERLHRIKSYQPQFVHWAGLWEQYGRGYKQIKNFRTKFRHHLMNVLAVYPDAKVEEVYAKNGMPKGLRLLSSKPPVCPKTSVHILNTSINANPIVDEPEEPKNDDNDGG